MGKVKGPVYTAPAAPDEDAEVDWGAEPSAEEISDEEFEVAHSAEPEDVGSGAGAAPVATTHNLPRTVKPSSHLEAIGRIALSVIPRVQYTLEQQEGMDALAAAFEELKVREEIRRHVSGAASTQSYSIEGSSAASSEAGDAASAYTEGGGEAKPTKKARREARRRSLKAVYGQEEDEDPDFDPEANGYVW